MTRLFHVSETAHIAHFEPRQADDGRMVVWAIDEAHLPNYLLPRDCPRVCVRKNAYAHVSDVNEWLGESPHTIYVENAWRERIASCRLFAYEFSAVSFASTDTNAGYFQSEIAVAPIAMQSIDDCEAALRARSVYLRYVESQQQALQTLQMRIARTTLEFSCIRMRNAS